MKKGTVVERDYAITNLENYVKTDFLKELDKITKEDGITILNRTINKAKSTVTIKARFDSDQWDICKALDYLSKNGITVNPVSDFVIIYESNECREKVKIIIDKIEEHESAEAV
tara:strand:+ start:719 stop:1060 length:342 start_codon:yes stop_codon:yes gene_type:complete